MFLLFIVPDNTWFGELGDRVTNSRDSQALGLRGGFGRPYRVSRPYPRDFVQSFGMEMGVRNAGWNLGFSVCRKLWNPWHFFFFFFNAPSYIQT